MGNLNISNVMPNAADNVSMVPGTGNVKGASKDQFAKMLSNLGNNLSDVNQNDVTGVKAQTKTDVSEAETAYKVNGSSAKDTIKAKVENDISPDTKQALSDTVSKIKEKITEDLGVSEEDLEKAMELLGLTDADLLTKSDLTQLTVELTGAQEPEALLVDENFQTLLSDVSGILADFTEQTGIDISSLVEFMDSPEQITEISPELQNALEQILGDDQVAVTNEDGTVSVISPEDVKNAINDSVKEISQGIAQETSGIKLDAPAETEVQKEPENLVNETLTMVSEASHQSSGNEAQSGFFEQSTPQNAAQAVEEAFKESETTEEVLDATASAFEQAATTQTVQEEAAAVTDTVTTPQTSYIDQETAQSMISQLTDQVTLQVSEESSTMEMTLNPATLGRLVISVTTRADEVSAQIYAQSEAVKQALESQMTTLRETLSAQGYKVTAVEVTVEEQAFDRNLEERARDEQNRRQAAEENQPQGRRNLVRGELDDLQGLMTEEEQLAARIMHENGNSMDLTA